MRLFYFSDTVSSLIQEETPLDDVLPVRNKTVGSHLAFAILLANQARRQSPDNARDIFIRIMNENPATAALLTKSPLPDNFDFASAALKNNLARHFILPSLNAVNQSTQEQPLEEKMAQSTALVSAKQNRSTGSENKLVSYDPLCCGITFEPIRYAIRFQGDPVTYEIFNAWNYLRLRNNNNSPYTRQPWQVIVEIKAYRFADSIQEYNPMGYLSGIYENLNNVFERPGQPFIYIFPELGINPGVAFWQEMMRNMAFNNNENFNQVPLNNNRILQGITSFITFGRVLSAVGVSTYTAASLAYYFQAVSVYYGAQYSVGIAAFAVPALLTNAQINYSAFTQTTRQLNANLNQFYSYINNAPSGYLRAEMRRYLIEVTNIRVLHEGVNRMLSRIYQSNEMRQQQHAERNGNIPQEINNDAPPRANNRCDQIAKYLVHVGKESARLGYKGLKLFSAVGSHVFGSNQTHEDHNRPRQ